jgi:hypothetical protein
MDTLVGERMAVIIQERHSETTRTKILKWFNKVGEHDADCIINDLFQSHYCMVTGDGNIWIKWRMDRVALWLSQDELLLILEWVGWEQ